MKAKEKADQKINKRENITCNATEVKKQEEKLKIQFCKAHRNGMAVQIIVTKTKLRGFSPRANHTDRAAAAGRRS